MKLFRKQNKKIGSNNNNPSTSAAAVISSTDSSSDASSSSLSDDDLGSVSNSTELSSSSSTTTDDDDDGSDDRDTTDEEFEEFSETQLINNASILRTSELENDESPVLNGAAAGATSGGEALSAAASNYLEILDTISNQSSQGDTGGAIVSATVKSQSPRSLSDQPRTLPPIATAVVVSSNNPTNPSGILHFRSY